MDRKEIICSRADMYRFLAGVFLAPPAAGVVSLLKEGWVADALEDFMTDETKKLFADAVESDVKVEDLKQEFNNLFVVPTGQYTVPFEAVFRDERELAGKKVKGLLMGPSTADVVKSYKRAGAKNLVKELPDHIGCELGFMEYLCSEEALAARAGKKDDARFFLEEQKRFLKDHLLQWMSPFVAKVSEKARLPWYKALSAAALGFVQCHFEELNCES